VSPLLQGKQEMERIVEERYHSSMFPQHVRERIGADRIVKVTIEESDLDERQAIVFDQAVMSAIADLDNGKAISAETALAALFARFGHSRESARAESAVELRLAPDAEAALHEIGAQIRSVDPDRVSTFLFLLLGHFLDTFVEGYPIQVDGVDDLRITEYRGYYLTHRARDNVREIVRISGSDHNVKGYRWRLPLTQIELSKLGVDVTYPIAVIEDRYRGTYSGGRWLAIADADAFENGLTRVAFCVEHGPGPSGEDGDARDFWSEPPHWIAAGDTADAAIENLRKQVLPEEASEI
jgi:hypothetical protein